MSVRANIYIDQGSTFTSQINLNDSEGNPVDLSFYTVQAQIRKDYSSINHTSFVASGNSSGVISLSLSANSTAALAAGRYVYDVRVIETLGIGVSTRIMEGQVTVRPSVSR